MNEPAHTGLALAELPADAATAEPEPVMSRPAPAWLVQRIVLLAIEHAAARASHNLKEQTLLAALIDDAVKHLQPHLGPVHVEPADKIEKHLEDRAGYEVWHDGDRIAIRIADATGCDAAVMLSTEQALQLRADLTSVLLGGGE